MTIQVWQGLTQTPLFGVALTLAAHQLAMQVFIRGKRHPLLNPVLIAMALVIATLVLTDTRFEDYFRGAGFIQWLLGPATVAMAVPLYLCLPTLRRMAWPVLAGLMAGVLTATVTAWAIAASLGAGPLTLLSLGPKTVSTPIAMGLSEAIGGLPSLSAAIVIVTGIVGAMLGPTMLRRLGIQDPGLQGLALGVAAHGIGAARAFQMSPETGAFAGLGMALAGLPTAVFVPVFMTAVGLH